MRVGSARDDPDAGHDHDARSGRVDRERAALGVEVALVVAAVPLGERGDSLAEGALQLVRSVAGGVEVGHERLVLRVDEVIGAGSADLAHLCDAGGGGERDRFGAPVDLQDDAVGVGQQRAAKGGQGRLQELGCSPVAELLELAAAEPERAPRCFLDRSRGARDEFDRVPVALLGRLAPRDEPVSFQEHRARRWIRVEEVGDPPRHVEPRTLIVEPHGLGPEGRLGELEPAGRRREGDDRVGVRMVDVLRRHERVQQGLDRGARLVGAERAMAEVVDHGRVAHLLTRAQRQNLVQPEGREARGRDRRQIGTGALDPQDARLPAGVVDDDALGGGVAAALVRHRAVLAEQVRAQNELAQGVEPGRRLVAPAIDRRRDASQDGRGLGHAPTSSRGRAEAEIAASRSPASRQAVVCEGS